MNRARVILAAAARQTRIELRVQLLSPMVFGWLWFPLVALVVMFFLRNQEVMGTAVSLAQLGIPGIVAASLVGAGVVGVAAQVITEREDGTLLRAKSVPGGMSAQLFGDVFTFAFTSIVPMLLLVGGGMLIVPGLQPANPWSLPLLLLVSLLGMAATLPWGALLGALLRSQLMIAWLSLVVYGSMAIAGIFYPLAALPGWLQVVGQILPTYWVGLGVRQALLPAEAVALEMGGSWHTGQMLTMLVVWTVVGLLLAPAALKRMARRQSGSVVAAARERIMNRGY